MIRLIPHTDMTADQILDVSYDIMAIFAIAEAAAMHMEVTDSTAPAWALKRLMALAGELYAPLHDALELHEGRQEGGEEMPE